MVFGICLVRILSGFYALNFGLSFQSATLSLTVFVFLVAVFNSEFEIESFLPFLALANSVLLFLMR